jgi:deaminated glutathione amidase
MRVAVIQMWAGADVADNWRRAERHVCEAAESGAELVILPEMFAEYGDLETAAHHAATLEGAPARKLAGFASSHQIWLLGGSICERDASSERILNTSQLFNPTGKAVATYRKIHLFAPQSGELKASSETAIFSPGEQVTTAETPWGKLGFSICYDLRFPELYRQLSAAGCVMIAAPSAFTWFSGRRHWEVLVRARAIENQCFVFAANQFGWHDSQRRSYGHSLIVDPQGEVLAEAPEDEEAIIYAELDFAAQAHFRQQLPALEHRRLRS